MDSKLLFLVCMLVIPAIPVYGEGLDPRTRDEDISGTQVSVSVTTDESGLYRYEYTVTHPPTNLGTVGLFMIDVSCDGPVEKRTDLSQLGLESGSASADGYHVPIATSGEMSGGVTEDNRALWGLFSAPGETDNLLIVSPYGPGNREYSIEPRMDPIGYDYETYNEIDYPSVPWIPDFTISGFTRGPACPGEEEPVETPRFAGSIYPNETETVNDLLTYSEPLRDRFHADAGVSEMTLTIHYSPDIEPRSFHVLPQKHNLRRLFNPVPGTSETVTLPLEPGKNKIQLQAKAKFLPRGKMSNESYGGRGPDMDQDDFEVRVGDSPANQGQAKGRDKS